MNDLKICGVIAEYNPFHRGHEYHLRETRRLTGCDYLVVCMDGSFTQRGEVACMDKWSRARAALRCGADAVFELPALWAVRPADAFALGGVATLAGIGCNQLSFGSETVDLQLLQTLSELRAEESPAITERIQKNLSMGKSHARARGEAIAEALNLPLGTLNAPNLILGAEYLRAIRELGVDMEAFAIPRIGNYHDESLEGFASATAIRAALNRGEGEAALGCLPEASRELLSAAPRLHAPDDLLLHTLRRMTEAEIAALPGVNEGLESRVLRCAQEASGQEALIEAIKCKRYTRARIARLCAHALLGMDQALCGRHPLPEYARLLGLRRDARPLMAELKQRAKLPIISNPTEIRESEIFQLECRATDLRALLCDSAEARRAGQEFTQKFVLE